ncbi:MAG: low molecular weight protein-tyrosine-phosphatase [Aerococcus sp.]|nr:low molecular weight protein-tyrosine-phosphatase [Aerococcus sp.]
MIPWPFYKKRVLFVCLANICRSPLAEALLRQALKEVGLSRVVQVDSAAIENWCVGQQMHQKLQECLANDHIAPRPHFSRLLKPQDGERFDYVIGMDQAITRAIQLRIDDQKQAHTYLFSQFQGKTFDIIDPMQTKDFPRTYREIKAGIPAIIHRLQQDLNSTEE